MHGHQGEGSGSQLGYDSRPRGHHHILGESHWTEVGKKN